MKANSQQRKKRHKWISKAVIAMLAWVGIPVLIVIGGTIIFFVENEVDLPKMQTINNSMLTEVNQYTYPADQYAYAYDWRTKGPSWVLQIIKPKDISSQTKTTNFNEDISVPEIMRPRPSNYENPDFIIEQLLDTSHLTHTSKNEVTRSTASPQLTAFNKGYWTKVNTYTKKLMGKLNADQVVVITGPLYLPHDGSKGKRYVSYQIIGEDNIAVPTHFFKAIFYPLETSNQGVFSTENEIYIIPNEDLDEKLPLESFKTSLEDFEKRAGILFPADISDYLIPFSMANLPRL